MGFDEYDKDRYLNTDRKGRGTSRKMTIDDRFEAYEIFCEYLIL